MASTKVRVVLKTAADVYRPILWFKATNKEEFFWGPYGLLDGSPVLVGEWNDRHTIADSKKIQRYRRITCKERSIVFDHFSSHVEGTFHLKCKNERGPAYSHILPKVAGIADDASVFLEATLLTDQVDLYRTSELRLSDQVINALPGDFLKIFFAIAGRNFSYSELMDDYIKPIEYSGPKFEFGPFQFQSIVASQGASDRPERHSGTVVSLRFETTSSLWLLKAFLIK